MKPTLTPARLAGILLVCLLTVLASTTPVLADHDNSQFDIISTSSERSSKWSTKGCTNDDDQDDGCYVEINAKSSLRSDLRDEEAKSNVTSWTQAWENLFEELCHGEVDNDDDYNEQNEAFNDCWEDGDGDVEWPMLKPSEDFEATGFCKSGDRYCAINIDICYNADECDGSSSTDDEFDTDDGYQAEFWDDNSSCLYDVSNSRFTDCVNRGLKRVYDQLARTGRFGYNNLRDELEDQGVHIDGYSRSLSDVEDRSYFGDEYLTWPYAPPAAPAPPAPPVYPYPPAQPPYDDTLYLDAIYVNYGDFLDTASGIGECNTAQGCIRVFGSGTGISSHLGRVFIQITDRQTRSCLAGHGIPYSGPMVMEFDDPVLKACHARIATANGACPARGIGVKAELLRMYNLGLLHGLLSPTHVQTLQQEVNSARLQAASCLCQSGFSNRDFVSVASGNPWDYNADARQPLLCQY